VLFESVSHVFPLGADSKAWESQVGKHVHFLLRQGCHYLCDAQCPDRAMIVSSKS
jgi:hypothetical protein